MTKDTSSLMDRLVADLEPVRPLAIWPVVLGLLLFAGLALAAVALRFGIRPDILALNPTMMVVWRSGTLLLLGLIAASAVLAAGRPAVGQGSRAWVGALAMASLIPATALVIALKDPEAAFRAIWWSSAIRCLWVSLMVATGFATILVVWLRRGAPISPERTGMLTGLAAGSLGVLVYSVHCMSNQVAYIGLWYTLAVTLSTAAGKFLLPPFIRW